MTLPATVAHGVQQCQEWLKEIRDDADLANEAEAWSVLRAVLHQLRDRLTVDEAAHLSAQLPLLVRGVYFEGWRPSRVPDPEVHSQQAFLAGVAERLLPHHLPTDRVTRVVFSILAHHIEPGEISDVIGQLPGDIKELWPVSARTFKERMR